MNKNQNWKRIYKRTLEISLISSLVIVILLLYSFKKYESKYVLPEMNQNTRIDVVPPPQTTQPPDRPKPVLPSIPVAEDNMELIEDVTFDVNSFAYNPGEVDIPIPEEADENIYEPFMISEPPEIIKKYKPEYPELARKTGIDGRVTVKVLIGKDGQIEKAEILKGNPMLNDAALEAAKRCTFKPGKQGIHKVRVWMSIPFDFQLR